MILLLVRMDVRGKQCFQNVFNVKKTVRKIFKTKKRENLKYYWIFFFATFSQIFDSAAFVAWGWADSWNFRSRLSRLKSQKLSLKDAESSDKLHSYGSGGTAVLRVVALTPQPEQPPPFTSTSFQALQSILQYPLTVSTFQLLLPTVALKVGSTWRVNDNRYVILLKFRLIGILDELRLISLPPAGAQLSVFHSRARTACCTVTLYFVSGPRLFGRQFTRFSAEYPHITPAADRMRARALLPWWQRVCRRVGGEVGRLSRQTRRASGGAGGGNSWCGSHHFKRAHLIHLEKI